MSHTNSDLEKKAERLERKAKEEGASKNYDIAILLLNDAKDIYSKLGYLGQIGILDKQINRYQQALDFEKKEILPSKELGQKRRLEADGNRLLEKAKIIKNKGQLEEALKIFKEALEIFEKLEFNYQVKQINWQIKKIEDEIFVNEIDSNEVSPDLKQQSISEIRKLRIKRELEAKKKKEASEKAGKSAFAKRKAIEEERRKKILLMAQEKKRKEEEEQKAWENSLKEAERKRQEEMKEREEKLRKIHEKKKAEEEFVAKADLLLEKGKECVNNKEFQEAKDYYRQAIEMFKDLGWNEQIQVLRAELSNIDLYEKQHEERMKEMILKKEKREKEFQERVDTILAEKKKKEQERLAQLNALPPELKKNLEKAKMNLQRAEREVEADKFERAIGRYKFVLELYATIPKDKMDLSEDISQINDKIEELKSRLEG